ncbi:roadblock/LC7 domain-containing protein [Deinococcus arenicola]|uniref:Roadblock/LC7 domain-containing protein n=1 Tax=Deinococcus arenicola TaxID=2994950 RepID=A0ABU4DRS6_9DEIO|nr:roadblock/LC7 domain-containing protein [Deinococcus sp. ZS9-10]MDV6375146.1 roadblock/LC7 domain-containing protein [Deinococcus sp. ZS9-10]
MKLAALNDVPGVVASALVGPDGLPIESYGDGGGALAAELAALRGSLDRMERRLGSGEITRLTVTSERIEIVALAAGKFTLGVALVRGHDTRSAQQTLAKLAQDVAALPHLERP